MHLEHGQQSWPRLSLTWKTGADAGGSYIPTRYPDNLSEGTPTDHFGRLQSSDALSHARALLDAIRLALADT